MKTLNRRTLLIAGASAVLVLGAAATAFAVISGSTPEAAPSRSASAAPAPSPSPTETPGPTSLPISAAVFGTIDGWSAPDIRTVASVLPQVGEASDGNVSAYVDAPVVDAETAVLETDVTVEPGTTYEVSVRARAASLEPVAVPAALTVGSARIALPELDARWQEVETTFVADGPTAHVALVLQGPVSGLGLDDLVISAQGDAAAANVVPNPSFEQVTTSGRIVNRSLVMPSERAVLAVTGAEGTADWVVVDGAGTQIAGGSQNLTGGVAAVPLEGVGQGYYTASVTDAAGTTTDAPIAVVDMPTGSIPLDARFGVGLHVENDYYADAAHLAASLGVGLARNDILWERNETTPGSYDFQPYYTDSFAALHAQGIHLLGIVNYGNGLYGSKKVPSNPEAIAAYGRYAAAIAERFDLVGLEVFNEFNHGRFNTAGCGTDPTCYMPLLQSVHDAVGAVDPELPIVAGSTANYEREWFDGLWRAGGLGLSDAVSYHPYQVVFGPEQLTGIVEESLRDMKDLGGDTRPVWITELGMTSTPAGLTLDGQADFALRATLAALEGGAEKYFWYDLINDSTDPNEHEGNFGLFFRPYEGVSALPPKPAAYAYALLISQVSGLQHTTNDQTPDGIHSLAFTGEDGRSVHTAWAPGGSGEITLSTDAPAEVVSFDGSTTVVQPVDGAVTVPLATTPVFIHLDPPGPVTGPQPSVSPTASPQS